MFNNEFALDQAIHAWYKVCKNGTPVFDKDGNMYSCLVYQQPARLSCSVGRKYVHLRNINGELARYNIKTGKITV